MYESTLKPFAKGDVFAAATQLNNPNDDHAGRGRILQYDAAGYEKGVLWLKDTTHLVGGLKFDANGVLWAFDSHAFAVLNILPNGQVVRRTEFPARPFSHVNFARDGSLLLGEHVVGSTIKPEIAARMHTQIPRMPNTDRFGDGHVWRFAPNGTLLKEYATQTHGGMGGFLGVTMSALAPDERTLVYCSETGPRLMRYDLLEDRQLPDLQAYQPPFQGPPEMFFGMDYGADGHLYVLRGARIDVVSDSGQTLRQIALPGFGWAIIDVTADGKYAYVGSFFSGEILKIDLGLGTSLGSIKTGGAKSLAGVVEYQGEGTPEWRRQHAPVIVAPTSLAGRRTRVATRKRRKPRKAAVARKRNAKPKVRAARKVAVKRKASVARKAPKRAVKRVVKPVTKRRKPAAKRKAVARRTRRKARRARR